MKPLAIALLASVFLFGGVGLGSEEIVVPTLVKAIRLAEGNENYGILKKIKGKNYRLACEQTIKHTLKDWDGRGDFIEFLGNRYAPRHVKNDPKDLNKNWVPNVKKIYARLLAE